jgi:hypothetical protein
MKKPFFDPTLEERLQQTTIGSGSLTAVRK